MKTKLTSICVAIGCIILLQSGCKFTNNVVEIQHNKIPEKFANWQDSSNNSTLKWREFFADDNLASLIDTALSNNQELNIILQEIEISKNEIRTRKGEYLPFVNLGAGSGLEKSGAYTRNGAVDEQLEIKQGTKFPKPLGDHMLGAYASWEIDIWKKLRNAKKAAFSKYMASIAGKNFMVTNLVAEIADAYYELMALDNLLDIIEKNIAIQSNALKVVKLQKESAKVTQLAVNRFEAQLLNTQNLRFAAKQRIIETENRINFLTGRFPEPIKRNSANFNQINVDNVQVGIPAQLLQNRPDIQQAEFEIAAAKLNVQVAKANFYPTVSIKAGLGFQAFNPTFLFNPQSALYNFAGDLMAPLINRNALKSAYSTANAKQLQALYNYEKLVLNAYLDVLNQLYKMDNYTQSYTTKNREVEILVQSIDIANSLFNSARADYAEVLLTQREALDSKFELVDIKLMQLNAKVNIYRALGGGWQ